MTKLSVNKMIEAIYKKVVLGGKPSLPFTPGMNPPGNMDGDTGEDAVEVWNLEPESGVDYPDIEVPDGYHLLYDWGPHKHIKLNRDCDTL